MNQYTFEEMDLLCHEASDRGLWLTLYFFNTVSTYEARELYSDEYIFETFFNNKDLLPSVTIQTDDGSSIHVPFDKKAVANIMYYEELNMIPLYINDPLLGIFARWRLKIGR